MKKEIKFNDLSTSLQNIIFFISLIVLTLCFFNLWNIININDIYSKINDLPKKVCWNETESLNKSEFCDKLVGDITPYNYTELVIKACLEGHLYEGMFYTNPNYLIKSTKEVCEIR